MRICVLGSGSKGNVTYIEGNNTRILIDAGLTCCDIENRLMQIGINPATINAILVTHEHSDHIKGLGSFARKFGTNIYTHNDTWGVLDNKIGNVKDSQKIEIFNNDFFINELTINSFPVDHDAVHCLGYSVICNQNKVSVATDLGHTTDNIIRNMMDSSLVVLESNHDVKTLLNNPSYPLRLKNRILSNNGHLSNDASSDAISQMLGYGVRAVVLAHLSPENNSPELALTTLKNRLDLEGADWGKELHLDLGHQEKIGNMYKLKE